MIVGLCNERGQTEVNETLDGDCESRVALLAELVHIDLPRGRV